VASGAAGPVATVVNSYLTAASGAAGPVATVVNSYLTAASGAAGLVAEQAADRKCLKYAELTAAYEFQPVAVETHGPFSALTVSFLVDLATVSHI